MPETTDKYHRIPIKERKDGWDVRTIQVTDGVKALVQVDPDNDGSSEIITYLLDVDKFGTMADAEAWVEKHKGSVSTKHLETAVRRASETRKPGKPSSSTRDGNRKMEARFKADASSEPRGIVSLELARPINPLDYSENMMELLEKVEKGEAVVTAKGIDTDGEFQLQIDVCRLGAAIVQGRQKIDVQHDCEPREAIKMVGVFVNDDLVQSPLYFPGSLVVQMDVNDDEQIKKGFFETGEFKSLSFHCNTWVNPVKIPLSYFEAT